MVNIFAEHSCMKIAKLIYYSFNFYLKKDLIFIIILLLQNEIQGIKITFFLLYPFFPFSIFFKRTRQLKRNFHANINYAARVQVPHTKRANGMNNSKKLVNGKRYLDVLNFKVIYYNGILKNFSIFYLIVIVKASYQKTLM